MIKIRVKTPVPLVIDFKKMQPDHGQDPSGDESSIIIPIVPPTIQKIPYEGPVTVTPDAHEETVLETKDRIVKEDITVETIPYSEVSNLEGGVTASIG